MLDITIIKRLFFYTLTMWICLDRTMLFTIANLSTLIKTLSFPSLPFSFCRYAKKDVIAIKINNHTQQSIAKTSSSNLKYKTTLNYRLKCDPVLCEIVFLNFENYVSFVSDKSVQHVLHTSLHVDPWNAIILRTLHNFEYQEK